MKKEIHTFFRTVCFSTLLLAAAPTSFAADKTGSKESHPSPIVRIELLMIAMPEEKFIALLPDLLDKDKIDKTIPLLLEAVKRKEMILEGHPFVTAKNGQRAVTETNKEIHDFNLEPLAVTIQKIINTPYIVDPSTPGPYDTRYAGVMVEAESTASEDHQSIDLQIAPQHCQLLGFQSPAKPGEKEGEFSTDDLNPVAGTPALFTMKCFSSLTLRNGQRMLLSTHKREQPEGYVEVFIVHAEILSFDQ